MSFESYQQMRVNRIEQFLALLLPLESQKTQSTLLYNAMRYSVLNGGKRIRPLLVYAVGEALGVPLKKLDAPAAAVELIHCYSLIHDDLPAMDNDDMRRGMPTCHKAFDEATAILAGDALQTLAFEILSDSKVNSFPAKQQVNMIRILAQKSGLEGMIDGQALDLQGCNKTAQMTVEELKLMHQKKTGCLIEASVLLGITAANQNLSETILNNLKQYASCIGLAFQIQDDILDVTGDSQQLGKNSGQDDKLSKITFPQKLGLERAKEYCSSLYNEALTAIEFLEEKAEPLANLAGLFVNRTH